MLKLMDLLKESLLNESVFDKSILKCVFMAGGPGSGKSYVAKEIFGMPNEKSISTKYDLKVVNPRAKVSVKLVSQPGIGVIASGVVKAGADVILVSGSDGGTGASPLGSLKHTGFPWEYGLAETHQVLNANGLRDRVILRVDGGIKWEKGIIIAAIFGAEEFDFGTSALVALGCVMARQCHLNTCPVGIATQDPELRKNFSGKPEHVINFMHYVAEELRKIMAKLGFRNINEMVGQSQKLNMRKAIKHFKAKGIDLSKVLYKPKVSKKIEIYNTKIQDHNLEKVLDQEIFRSIKNKILNKIPVSLNMKITNTNRSTGAILSNEISKLYGADGLPDDMIKILFNGTAGQSFGAFCAKGISMKVMGNCNDYFGKGLSGGKLIVQVPRESSFEADKNIIIGNVALYGATSGEIYVNGIAGERFCVRNSGATAVVEGIGDHGCEYMTGGVAVILGDFGRNFAAGMSGGIAYLYIGDGNYDSNKFNLEMIELEDLKKQDKETLFNLISNHFKYTESKKAKKILNSWPKEMKRFIKVMPTDYKRALEILAKETTKN